MDAKKLRKTSKKELLELLLQQARRIKELELELNETKIKLNSKKIAITESGTLAEASLRLNGIFESAQETIDQYMLNIKDKCKNLEDKTKKECQIIKETMLKETEQLCNKKKEEADKYLEEIKLKVKELNKNNKSTKDKIVIQKSNKNIKGRPVKTIKKGMVVSE